jgi:hypothetical protein
LEKITPILSSEEKKCTLNDKNINSQTAIEALKK